MATRYGISATGFIPQPDFEANQSENGGWTASQSFVYRTEDLDNYALQANFSQGVSATDLDDSLPSYWSFLYLKSVSVGESEGGYSRIRVNYSGFVNADGYGGSGSAIYGVTTYGLSGSVSQRSIIDHPSVVALDDTERKKLGMLLDGGIYYDVTSEKYRQETTLKPFGDEITFTAGDSATFAAKIVMGRTTFDSPTILWNEYREQAVALTASELNDIGKVSTPAGSPPAVTGSRDWKLNSATQDWDGVKYRISRQWELSLAGGWDSETYDY